MQKWVDLRVTVDDLERVFAGRNVGVNLGASGGLVDLDLDVPEAVKLASRFALPTGAIFGRESAPASHWLYKCPKLEKIVSFCTEDGVTLVELRARDHQTMLPGSVHPSGEEVRWDADGVPAAAKPDDLIQTAGLIAAAALLVRRWPGPGKRHAAALALSGLLARNDWAADEIEFFVGAVHPREDHTGAAQSSAVKAEAGEPVTGAPTLSRLVGQQVVDRVIQWLDLDLEEWDEPEPFASGEQVPFPLSTLPAWLRSWVENLAAHYQCDAGLPAGMAIAVLSACVAKRWVVKPNDSWEEPVNVWCALIADPGGNKSQMFSLASRPLVAKEQELYAEWRETEAQRSAERASVALALKAATKRAADPNLGDDLRQQFVDERDRLARQSLDLEESPAPRLLTDDATSEALASLMHGNGGRIAVLSGEGRMFDHVMGAYGERGRPTNLNVYLKGHAGDDLTVDRIGREPQLIPNATLTVGIAVQPEVVTGVTSRANFSGVGFLARWLYFWPVSHVGSRTWTAASPQIDPLVQDRYEQRMLELLAQRTRYTAKFTPEAAQRFCVYMTDVERRLMPDGDLAGLHHWGTKLRGAVLRLAGLLHVAQQGDGEPSQSLPLRTLESAIRLGEYFVQHAKYTFGRAGLAGAVEAEALWKVIAKETEWRRDGFKLRDVHQKVKRRTMFRRSAAVREALSRLEEMGYVQIFRRGRRLRGRINPKGEV